MPGAGFSRGVTPFSERASQLSARVSHSNRLRFHFSTGLRIQNVIEQASRQEALERERQTRVTGSCVTRARVSDRQRFEDNISYVFGTTCNLARALVAGVQALER